MRLPATQGGPCDIILKLSTESREMRIDPKPQVPEQWEDMIPESHGHTRFWQESTIFYWCLPNLFFFFTIMLWPYIQY